MSENGIIKSCRRILMITNILVLVMGPLSLLYICLTIELPRGMASLTVAFVRMIWAFILVFTPICFLGITCTNSICLHLIAALLLCTPVALICWMIVNDREYPNWSLIETLIVIMNLIWAVQMTAHVSIIYALCGQLLETTSTANVASSPAPSAPSGITTSGGAFVPLAQAPPTEKVHEGEDDDEEDEEKEQDSQAGVQTVGGSNRPLSSNIRTSPGYISGSGVQYRSTSYTSSFQQNNPSEDSSRINNTNSDAVLMRPLSEDRLRLVQQMPGHYHGAIAALGSGLGAVSPLATTEDTGV